MKLLSAFFCGWLFAIGLGLAGMTQPAKVIGFLDLFGIWDPSLMFVMGGAVLLGLAAFPWVLKQPKPLLEARFTLPEPARVDARLLWGAAWFGIGWGMAGYCPGPALVSLVTANLSVWVFVAAMLLGSGLGQWWTGRK